MFSNFRQLQSVEVLVITSLGVLAALLSNPL